ncbi:hypothetical protein Goklo_005633 [Gossypium klotzschianum]|uniref:Uncharacterized protein n=2 Tax=Gossypium TaxID=3633 RepID=A0A7J8MSK8_9ROSI|nr:hypothetical protein [Gossypium lobatum]MBA0661324.1 hypothetical protein [Gossypium klotzschianum]
MERSSSSLSPNEEQLLSCWGRLKLKLPWTKRKIRSLGHSITAAFRAKRPRPVGGFKYDPLSYAQNFDDGYGDDDPEGALYHGFSSRYAAPSSRSVTDNEHVPCMVNVKYKVAAVGIYCMIGFNCESTSSMDEPVESKV